MGLLDVTSLRDWVDHDDNKISEQLTVLFTRGSYLNHKILQMNREETQRKGKEAEHALEEVRRSPDE